jgi:hypothetical protein
MNAQSPHGTSNLKPYKALIAGLRLNPWGQAGCPKGKDTIWQMIAAAITVQDLIIALK